MNNSGINISYTIEYDHLIYHEKSYVHVVFALRFDYIVHM